MLSLVTFQPTTVCTIIIANTISVTGLVHAYAVSMCGVREMSMAYDTNHL